MQASLPASLAFTVAYYSRFTNLFDVFSDAHGNQYKLRPMATHAGSLLLVPDPLPQQQQSPSQQQQGRQQPLHAESEGPSASREAQQQATQDRDSSAAVGEQQPRPGSTDQQPPAQTATAAAQEQANELRWGSELPAAAPSAAAPSAAAAVLSLVLSAVPSPLQVVQLLLKRLTDGDLSVGKYAAAYKQCMQSFLDTSSDVVQATANSGQDSRGGQLGQQQAQQEGVSWGSLLGETLLVRRRQAGAGGSAAVTASYSTFYGRLRTGSTRARIMLR